MIGLRALTLLSGLAFVAPFLGAWAQGAYLPRDSQPIAPWALFLSSTSTATLDEDIVIIDETRVVEVDLSTLDLGPKTDLGPGSLNLSAMAALDQQIAALSAEGGDFGGVEAAFLPAPFACDLPALTQELTDAVAIAIPEVLELWEVYTDERGINEMPNETEEEICAVNQALIYALSDAAQDYRVGCSPISISLGIVLALQELPGPSQARFSRKLSLLAQKVDEYNFRGLPPTDLCPDYKALEAELLSAISG